MTDLVERVDDGAVRVLRLNRPDARNALNMALIKAIRTEFAAVARDDVRCLVITGNGKGFSAGADVKEWSELAETGVPEGYDWVGEMHRLILDLHAMETPTIAMINGAAVGAGLDMALTCDFRFAAAEAKFRCAYTWVGFNPDAGGTWLMPRLMGMEAAKRFAFTGDIWPADKAMAHGLVTEVHPLESLEDATMAFARQLGNGPTVAIRQTKRLMETATMRTLAEQLQAESAAGKICAETEDHKEALAAAVERREPAFKGR
jgi:2-(1,2-epoxy-1,2-dihydrophenyl)acetyl-CoA isomerase